MAGGGGAWKVAYADFVTAMMAFFLVMWLVSQNDKIKEAVANYFVDPMGYEAVGSSVKPVEQGSLMEAHNNGNVPNAQTLATGRGRRNYSSQDHVTAHSTQMVSNWLRTDEASKDSWINRAREIRESVANSAVGDENPERLDEETARRLSAEMKEKTLQGIPKDSDGIYFDMLNDSLSNVNWNEIAEDLISY